MDISHYAEAVLNELGEPINDAWVTPMFTPQDRSMLSFNPSQPVINPNARLKQLLGTFSSNPIGSYGVGPTSAGGAFTAGRYIPSMNSNGAGRPLGVATGFGTGGFGSTMPSTGGMAGFGASVGTVRSPAVQTALNGAFANRSANQGTANQSLTDWTKEFLANRDQQNGYTGQETDAIGRYYGTGPGSVSGDLSQIRQNQASSLRDLTEAAYRRAGQANSLRRMGASGVSGSSYLDHIYAQDLGNIAAQGAYRSGDQERNDLQYVNSARTGLAGTRGQLSDALINRALMPSQVSNQLEGQNLSNLGSIANLDYGNNNYQPAEDAYMKRADFLQQLINMGLA